MPTTSAPSAATGPVALWKKAGSGSTSGVTASTVISSSWACCGTSGKRPSPPVPPRFSNNPKEPTNHGGKSVENLSLDLVFPNPNQPRKIFDETALAELAASIRERGVMEPIIVRPKDGTYEIVAGERRYRASKLAGMTDVPAVVRDLSDEDAAAEALLENFQREDLTAIEKAHAIQGLL